MSYFLNDSRRTSRNHFPCMNVRLVLLARNTDRQVYRTNVQRQRFPIISTDVNVEGWMCMLYAVHTCNMTTSEASNTDCQVYRINVQRQCLPIISTDVKVDVDECGCYTRYTHVTYPASSAIWLLAYRLRTCNFAIIKPNDSFAVAWHASADMARSMNAVEKDVLLGDWYVVFPWRFSGQGQGQGQEP